MTVGKTLALPLLAEGWGRWALHMRQGVFWVDRRRENGWCSL